MEIIIAVEGIIAISECAIKNPVSLKAHRVKNNSSN
jgi:hypothetical protein